MLGFLPGMSKQDIIERELQNNDLNARGTGFADRVGSWNWQDNIGAFLAGTNKEEVLSGAKTLRDKRLNERFASDAATNAANLGNLTATFKGANGKTVAEMESALAVDAGRARALQTAIADGVLDPSSLSTNASAGAILGANAKAKIADTDSRNQLERDRIQAETLRQEGRVDSKENIARLDRLSQEKQNLELRRDNMNLEYARMERQDRMAAQDRRDKAIMMLLQGLGNLGTAFTI